MKKIGQIREGSRIKVDPEDKLRFFIRGKSSNGRVHAKCYHIDYGRVRHLDLSLTRDTKVTLI